MGLFGKKQIFDSTKEDTAPHVFRMEGKTISCSHCGNLHFVQKAILLNTTGMTFFSLDWANRTAATLSCTQCGQILWFLQQPEVVAE
jgi:predicted nucleic-acid-binding Zn-ribbon protein